MLDREIRFFLSSTFRDLQEERTALVQLFDRLRSQVASRGVYLSVVDLRWGITEEEAQSGKVMELCLNEIDRSRPFFIGIIGSQYGTTLSIPNLPKEFVDRYPWIKEDIEKGYSITEIEIQYGALRRKGDSEAVFFILENTASSETDPHLEAFKKRIMEQKRYPVIAFKTTAELCDKAEQYLRPLIEKYYPDKEMPLVERMRQEQFSYIRTYHSAFVERPEEAAVLDGFVNSEEPMLAITGEQGCGKSALLANWVASRYSSLSSVYNVVYHSLDNSFSNNSPESLLHHLKEELIDFCPFLKKASGPARNDSLSTIRDLLNEAKSGGGKPLMVIIDGLNNLEDEYKQLAWIPKQPGFVKYIFASTPNDKTTDALRRWGCPIVAIGSLTPQMLGEFVTKYLATCGKKMSGEEISSLLSAPISHNILALKTMLDELIRFGEFDQLQSQILSYVGARDLSDFFFDFILRLRNEYGKDGFMVLHAMILIALSRRGLTHDEIIDQTNSRAVDWKSFYAAFESLFVEQNGLINYSNGVVKQAVLDRFLDDPNDVYIYRKELIDGFSFRLTSKYEDICRWLSEECYQFYSLGDAEALFGLLRQFGYFVYFYHNEEPSLLKYWKWLIDKDKEAYSLSVYLDACQDAEDCLWVGMFVYKGFSDYRIAFQYAKKALPLITNPSSRLSIQIKDLYAWLAYKNGDASSAITQYDSLLKELGTDSEEEAESFYFVNNNLSAVYSALWQCDKARLCNEKNLAICQKYNWPLRSALTYAQLGSIEHRLANYGKALHLLKKAEDLLYPVVGDENVNMGIILKETGEVYDSIGDYSRALVYLKRSLGASKRVYGDSFPETGEVLSNMGLVYYNLQQYDTALQYCMEAQKIYELHRQVQNHAVNLNRIGIILGKLRRTDEAMASLRKAIELQRSHYGKQDPDLASFYSNLAAICHNTGDIKQALELESAAADIRSACLPHTHPDYLWSLAHRIVLLIQSYGLKNAEAELLKANALMQEGVGEGIEYDAQTIEFIAHNMANYCESKDSEEILKYQQQLLHHYESRYGKDSLWVASAMIGLANSYRHFLYWDTAAAYYLKAYEIFEKHPSDEEGMRMNLLESLGEIHFRIAEYPSAIHFYRIKLSKLTEDGRRKNRREIQRIKAIISRAKKEMIHPTIFSVWKKDSQKPY